MPITHVPAQPAVTKIVEVSPATPEKYVLELTLHQALCLAVLSETTFGWDDGDLWKALCNHPLYEAYRAQREEAAVRGRPPLFKDLTVSGVQQDAPAPDFIRVRRVAEDVCWTVGMVYTVDMTRDFSSGRHPGVVFDDDGDPRIYFPEDFEPI